MQSPSSPDDPLRPDPLLPASGKPEVPVFDCRVLIKRMGNAGPFQARAATLPNIQVEAATQREALQALVRTFKMTVAGYYERGEAVPWLEPPLEPEAGEQMLWLPVHL